MKYYTITRTITNIWPLIESVSKFLYLNKRVKNKLYDDLGIDNPYLQNQPKGRIDRFKKFVKKLYESNEVDKPALK
jgi:hypothetical protein